MISTVNFECYKSEEVRIILLIIGIIIFIQFLYNIRVIILMGSTTSIIYLYKVIILCSVVAAISTVIGTLITQKEFLSANMNT